MEGTRPLTGPALTNDLCGQYIKINVKISAVFDFNILIALKGWVGHAPQGRGALHNHNYRHCAFHIIFIIVG
jgi:hypothetical protein